MQKHDGLWKELLRTFFSEFLELVVPQIVVTLETEKRRFLEQEAFTDFKDGSHARMDLVAEVPARGQPGRLVVVHIEVQRDFGVSMDKRVFRYFAHLKLKFDLPVVPIVLFLRGGPAGLETRHYKEVIEGFTVNHFSYCAVGLSRAGVNDFLTTSALGPALASCTRGDDLPPYERKFRCVEAILDARVDDAQQVLLLNAVETYLRLTENQQVKYNHRVSKSSKREEVVRMEMTWADRLHQRGRREGVEKGRLEGAEMGRREMGQRLLLRLVTKRFGEPSSTLKRRIAELGDLEELESLSERVFFTESLADLGLDE